MKKNENIKHSEEITCITVVKSLSCFITSSKDKFVKIYNYIAHHYQIYQIFQNGILMDAHHYQIFPIYLNGILIK